MRKHVGDAPRIRRYNYLSTSHCLEHYVAHGFCFRSINEGVG